MKKFLVLLAISAFLASNTFADVRLPDTPQPKQAKSIDAHMTIRFVKDAKEAKLIIPKSQVKQLRAELEQLDNDSDTNTSLNFTRMQTIISGMFLSLAFVFGGVWFARSRKPELKANKILAIGAILFLTGSFATIAFANVGPPPEARRITSKLFDQSLFKYYGFASGKIKLEITTERDSIELIVPDMRNESRSGEE
jgi:hypothetical protein